MAPTERARTGQQNITDWQVSGVSGSVYCKQQALIYHQFVYWRKKQKRTVGLHVWCRFPARAR
jgi:hypothetical protein